MSKRQRAVQQLGANLELASAHVIDLFQTASIATESDLDELGSYIVKLSEEVDPRYADLQGKLMTLIEFLCHYSVPKSKAGRASLVRTDSLRPQSLSYLLLKVL